MLGETDEEEVLGTNLYFDFEDEQQPHDDPIFPFQSSQPVFNPILGSYDFETVFRNESESVHREDLISAPLEFTLAPPALTKPTETETMQKTVSVGMPTVGITVPTSVAETQSQEDDATSEDDSSSSEDSSDDSVIPDFDAQQPENVVDSESDFEDEMREPTPSPPKKTTRKAKGKGVIKPVNHQAIKKRYNELSDNKFLVERAYHPWLLEERLGTKHRLLAQSWGNLIDIPCDFNETWVKEFYATAGWVKEDIVTIRGCEVDWSREKINEVMKLSPPFVCTYHHISTGLKPIRNEEISDEILEEGYGWSTEGRHPQIKATHLHDESALWFQFIRHNVTPTVHDSSLPKERAILLYCILKEKPVDFGQIAHEALVSATSRMKGRLIFPCLITKLMKAAKVPRFDDDIESYASNHIGNDTLARRHRARSISAGTQPPPMTTQPPPSTQPGPSEQQPPRARARIIPESEHGYGTEIWLDVLAHQQEETNELLKSIKEQMKLMETKLNDMGTKMEAMEQKIEAISQLLPQTAVSMPTVGNAPAHSGQSA